MGDDCMDAGGRATQDAQVEGARRAGEGHAGDSVLAWRFSHCPDPDSVGAAGRHSASAANRG
ncbi:hypothetical protein EGJ86_18515 [Pseudomonas sp. o96-267]|nr:hypothetical protein EGJ86_18515 [Pseudomonas sp. o96-267]